VEGSFRSYRRVPPFAGLEGAIPASLGSGKQVLCDPLDERSQKRSLRWKSDQAI
jgi:hypothetical protein